MPLLRSTGMLSVKNICDRCKKLVKIELVVLEEKTVTGGWLMDILLCKKCERDLQNLIKKWLNGA
jgi:hypothetical protein